MRCLLPEWAPQSGVMLTWPHQHGIWADFLAEADLCFTEIAKQLSHYELVLITCYDHIHKKHILQLLSTAGAELNKIRFFEAKSNDIWVRDHGPLSVLNEHNVQLMDFLFNAWGGKYSYTEDNAITRMLYEQGAFNDVALESVKFVLEGGGIEVDGKGTLLTTESVLLAKTRNNTNKEAVEKLCKASFGIDRILWLKNGHLVGDDTDGHIDTLARFVNARTICYVGCTDQKDEHYEPLKKMREELAAFRDYEGNPYTLIELPFPAAQFSKNNTRLPATYANFLIINKAVLMPIYGDHANDKLAEKILQNCFPERKIIPINCRVLINYYGSLHCATMQLPEGVLA